MSVSPQMRIALGHMYERDTHYILEDLGFTDIHWMNERGESCLSYDYVATKDGKDFFIEVKSYFPSNPVPFRKRKFDALAPLRNVLLVLWHVKDEIVDVILLDAALRKGLIKVNKKPYSKRTRRRPRRKTTIMLPIDRLTFLDNCAEATRKDRSSFLTLVLDKFHDQIVAFAKGGYIEFLQEVKAVTIEGVNNEEKVEAVQT